LQPSCAAIMDILRQLAAANAPADVRRQADKLVVRQKALCDAYNKLRSLAADWEAAEGVKNPVFYVRPYAETGEPVVSGGSCRLKKSGDST